MLLGSDLLADVVFGGYDPAFSGIGIHARSGELMTDKLGVSSMDFGATLLALADIDPQPYLPQGRFCPQSWAPHKRAHRGPYLRCRQSLIFRPRGGGDKKASCSYHPLAEIHP